MTKPGGPSLAFLTRDEPPQLIESKETASTEAVFLCE